MQRLRPRHGVIVAHLADPADHPAERQAGEEQRVADPHDRRQQDEEHGLGRDAGEKARGAAEGAAELGPRQHVDHGRDLRREPHDENDGEQRVPGVRAG